MFKAHEDTWVEGLVAARTGPDPLDERVLTFAADGLVRSWELDAEQGCDVYRLLDEARLADCSVRCLAHQPDRDCLIAGCADGTVRIHFADGRVPTCNDMPLPTLLQAHEGVVSGLALVAPNVLLSAGHDGMLRLWDLSTIKQLLAEAGSARRSPITCLEWCAARQEAAICTQSSKVYVWSLKRPHQLRLSLVLDHSEPTQQSQQKQQPDAENGTAAAAAAGAAAGAEDVTPSKPINMRWLTRSDIEGLPGPDANADPRPPQYPDLVAEAIRDAGFDIPEVTQIRWAAFRESWVTAADDDVIRLWGADGRRLEALPSKGGRVGCLYVDESREVLLAGAADRCVYVYGLDEPAPLARYCGHEDAVTAICHLSALNVYMTSEVVWSVGWLVGPGAVWFGVWLVGLRTLQLG